LNRGYRLTERSDHLVFETVLYRTGEGSALNRLVYNRELGALLIAVTAAGATYAVLAHGGNPGWPGYVLPVLVLIPVFIVVRFRLFRDRVLRLEADRRTGSITVWRDGIWKRRAQSARIDDLQLLEVGEQEAPDESDIQDIVRWHEIAEPGVHATPLPVFTLELVFRDGGRVLIFTDCVVEPVNEVRRRLGGFFGLL